MNAKQELLDKVIACTKWGNKRGVAAIILGQQCGYPLGVIKSRSSKEPLNLDVLILNRGQSEGNNLGFIDFVFDHKTGFIGITFSKKKNPHGHDGIANALQSPGASGSDEREESIVGGKIAFLNGVFITTEWSGHYGILWNEGIIEHFQRTFFWSTKQPIHHIKWKDDAPVKNHAAGNEKPSSKFLVSCGFFALNDSVTKKDIAANLPLNSQTCDLIASYLPKK